MITLKTATLVDDYAWIWENDDALDRTKEGWRDEYRAALESHDMARMPLRPGAQPTIFWLRHPTPSMRRRFAGLVADVATFPLGLRRIAAMSIVKAEHVGIHLEWDGADPETRLPCVPDATMDALEMVGAGALVNAIAMSIMEALSPKN